MPRDRSKARELQERKKKGSVDELQLRLEKESEELKQSRLNQKAKIQRIKDRKKQAFLEKVEKDLPNLYLGIFVPCIMAVITICTATVATSIGGNGCNVGLNVGFPFTLQVYLWCSSIVAYTFLFGLSMMFIGSELELPTCCGKLPCPDCRCKKMSSVLKFYGFIFFFALLFNIFGLVAFLEAGSCVDNPSADNYEPLLYYSALLQVIFFWGALFVLIIFGIDAAIKRTKQAAKQLEAKRHAEMEKRVAEEYDGFEGEEGEYEEGEYEEEEEDGKK